MDDGELTKQLCPETEVIEENEDYEPCCACDEAKYEVSPLILVCFKYL